MGQAELDQRHMRRALQLAAQGEGFVEPNPMVGCVVAHGEEEVGAGFHQRYGQAHAEVNALREAADRAQGATLYVTLEPCSHVGKTPPCAEAVIAAGVKRVVIAVADPFPKVDGRGMAALRDAGIEVEEGVEREAALSLLAPYLKLVETGRPWVIGKWAMTLDGKIATRTGSSQWISSERSLEIVHRLRGRVDAIIVGRRTAITDDPTLTARPAGQRVPTRVVLGSPPREGKLFQTIDQAPVLIVAGSADEAEQLSWATNAGAEVVALGGEGNAEKFAAVMDELGRRRMTNVLVEGGGGVLGAALDAGELDEAHVFIGPKLVGGQPSPSPMGGGGVDLMSNARLLASMEVEKVGPDAYLHGRLTR